MAKRVDKSSSIDNLLNNTHLPYRVEIIVVPLPTKFKLPQIDLYNEFKDLVEHLETFKVHMKLHAYLGEITWWAFLLTLRVMARGWPGNLQSSFITIFEELGKQLLMQFMASKWRRWPIAYLLTMKQQEDESLEAYLTQFNKECLTMEKQDEKITLVALLGRV